ncbi:MAG TPA: serine hydrolase domain-containing protein [Beijerinckiaceae bacterium]|jgi:CubicO group peptidase (beta-lactamase class C family)
MLRPFGYAALLLTLGTAPVRAEDPLPRATPESVGMSSERLARLDAALKAEVERGRLPGAVVAVARRGRLVHYEAYGHVDPAAKTTMPRDGIFAIASMTKPFVGTAIMMLLEEGKLALNDPIERHLPELGNRRVATLDETAPANGQLATVPARRPVTILDLARHTSGITYGGRGTTPVHKMYPASSNWAGENLTGAEFLKQLAAAPLLYQPGTVWDYSLSIDVLGLVVEKVSGKPLSAFLQERLWRPLGMKDTGFVVPASSASRLARPLATDPDTGKPQSVPDRSKPLKFECGGGCAASTAGDYLRFAQMLLDGGALDGTRILGRKTVEAMTADQMTPEISNRIAVTDPNAAGYGFGVTVAVRPATGGGGGLVGSPGDFYWNGAYGTLWWADPEERLAVVFMTHTPGDQRREYRRLVNALVYQAIVE